MASGTSGRRRTGTQKKTTAASRKAAQKKREETAFIRDEIQILILFAVSVLLLISNFGVGGAAGSFVSSVMFGLFGFFAYLLPVGLFIITAFSISNRENTIAVVKAAAMGVGFFLLCAIAQLVSGRRTGQGRPQLSMPIRQSIRRAAVSLAECSAKDLPALLELWVHGLFS